MNESTCSSKFQTKVREALPGCVLIKHADKSMVGCLDASLTFNGATLWMEYKFIGPQTKGVLGSAFLSKGEWSPLAVASASPTQAEMGRKLAIAGKCLYIFWVLDHKALRKRVGYVVMWHPITGLTTKRKPDELVTSIAEIMQTSATSLF